MYCKYCGKEIDESAKFCPYCGAHLENPSAGEQSSNAGQQSGGQASGDPFGYAQGGQQPYNGQPPYNSQPPYNGQPYRNPEDRRSGGFAFLCFLFPVVGLILYLVWKDTMPLRAKSCGKGAIIGVIFYVVFVILMVVIAVVAIPPEYWDYWDYYYYYYSY